MNPKRRYRIIAAALAAGIVLPFAVYFSARAFQSGPWDEIKIATGPPGGTYHALGEQLAWSLSELPGNPIRKPTPIPTAGAVRNLDMLLGRDADFRWL